MYRILTEHDEVRERRNQRQHPQNTKPQLVASRPNKLWSWDITLLAGPGRRLFYLLPLRYLGCLQPLRRRLAGGRRGIVRVG
jgi:hypothetical protein